VADGGVLELSTDDVGDLEMLYSELNGTPGITVEALFSQMQPGDQGGLIDFLTVACSGGAITVFLQIIKALIDSRGPQFVLKIRHGKDRIEITSANVDEVLPAIRALVDELWSVWIAGNFDRKFQVPRSAYT
jgi:Effector Associated Constant Component 1